MVSDEDFNKIVSGDVRWQDPDDIEGRAVRNSVDDQQRSWLRQPENLQRWIEELTAIMRKIDSQLTTHRAEAFRKQVECKSEQEWLEFQASDAAWRASALRFKRSVGDRHAEAKRLLREYRERQESEHEEVVRLRAAIVRHKDNIEDDVTSEADEELWALVQ